MADELKKLPLLGRIAAKQSNQVTMVKLVLSSVIRQVTEIETWHKEIGHLNSRQLIAMLHITTKMRADIQTMRAVINDEEKWDTLDTQAQVLSGIVRDVAARLRAIGANMDTVLSELHLVEMAEISLSSAINTFSMISSEDVQKIQMNADFPGLVQWLENSEPMSIVAALMQIEIIDGKDKATEVAKLLKEAGKI